MRRLAGAAAALTILALPLFGAGPARAAEYEMPTVARYLVDPAAGSIAVSVDVTFTNTTPNPAGQVSGFDHIDVAVHQGASQVAAADASGSLSVALSPAGGAQIASVKSRARVRYNGSVSFRLTYLLADGSAPEVHVRSQVVKFPVFGFGTSSNVTVDLPASFEARADGDPMVSATAADVLSMTSGPIANPAAWFALVTASRPSSFATQVASVALDSATVDLQVRAWSDDPGWGERTLAMLVAALPILEAEIGLPYPRVGPLVVTEAVGGEEGADDPPGSNPELLAEFDGAGFTLLHQAAHIWISERLATDPWIREGLASHFAARAAAGMDVALPYDPAARAGEMATDAMPLVGWGGGATGGGIDAYAYAASWAVVDGIATSVGEAQLSEALQRVVAGISAYEPLGAGDPVPSARGHAPVDTRRLLDQLTAVGGTDVADLFKGVVFGPEADAELAARAAARTDYADLAAASGDWGTPEPIRVAMAAWRFDRARPAIAQAAAWLRQRDILVAKITRAGLTTPRRLKELFVAGGGESEAQAELEAETTVVDAFLELQARPASADGLLERIGLFAADDPRLLLTAAGTSFDAGDLQAAAEALDQAELQLNRAPADGVVRIASAIVVITVAIVLVTHTIRLRRGSHYTAAP